LARSFAAAGNPGNYYRWWDAAEGPIAFSQQVLAPLTEISIGPQPPATWCLSTQESIDELSPVYDVHLHFGGLNE